MGTWVITLVLAVAVVYGVYWAGFRRGARYAVRGLRELGVMGDDKMEEVMNGGGH